MRVSNKVSVGEEINSKAEVTAEKIKEETNEVTIEIVGKTKALGSVENENIASTQGAFIFGAGSSFFPQTIFGWLLLLILILLIAFGVYKVGNLENVKQYKKKRLLGGFSLFKSLL